MTKIEAEKATKETKEKEKAKLYDAESRDKASWGTYYRMFRHM